MRKWELRYSHRVGQYFVVIYDVSWWRELAADSFDKLCGLTGGVIGGHGMPEWAWETPVPKWLSTLETKILFLDAKDDPRRSVWIDREVAIDLDPEFVRRIEGED